MADQSTQSFLEIQDIREGILILKNNDIRGVLMVSSANFALKSDEDQAVIIYAFQNFLNSLDFSCQIVVQSRKINITPYLDSLKKLQEKQTNELLKIQNASYIDFIKELVQGDSVMTKNFYVVVPYALAAIFGASAVVGQLNPLKLFTKGGDKNKKMNDEDFEKCKNQLWQRMEFLALGLKRCGLDSVLLTTAELIELFWAIHHPDQAEIGYSPEIMPELLK
ncbi:MAG: hypothetical protein A2908_00905 [Candidatus Staskawiczbacteria bacterium RIFCSPLOWO2_01_FULL_38_12b]|uniref:TraC-like domain-containing protein n=1 Tax=Candidatus Staskawiczbacteria bacterium RIFCSPLOWO2_01_FULL_38_12b TaxID=1802214 RepID=A0A1G2IHE6_9BACT|nr:MAG: hypothetical protein A2908_00905 [Candidatus Staskawiczbacteria bacterium RIFCSPLOWO2_01_FULL_38_12b]